MSAVRAPAPLVLIALLLTGVAHAQDSLRPTHDLLALARLGTRGPIIKLGAGEPSLSAIVGGFNTGFSLDEVGALVASGREAELVLPLDPARAHRVRVVVTPRSQGPLALFANGRGVGRARLRGAVRQTIDFDVPALGKLGARDTYLTFAFHGGARAVGRLFRGRRVLQKNVKEPVRATFHLVEVAPTGVDEAGDQTTLDVYAFIAKGARFEGRSEGDAVSLRVAAGAAPPEDVLLQRRESGVSFASLSKYAGEIVRITLSSRGAAAWKEARIVAPVPEAFAAAASAQKPKNVVLWVIDTLRADKLRCINERTRVRTPNFDSFAKRGVLFKRALSQSSHSKPAAATIMTGHYPASHGASTHHEKLRRELPLLPELYKQAGYETAGFASNGFIGKKHGFVRGWDHFENLLLRGKPGKAPYLLREVNRWLDKPREKPFFLYVHSVDPHVPYNPPRNFLSFYWQGRYRGRLVPRRTGFQLDDARAGKFKVGATDKIYAQALYDGEVSVADHFFGRFLDTLLAKGLAKDTLVVVTADHGEELWDHGQPGHGHTLFDELIRVPLLFGPAPLVPAGRIVDATVEMVDLVPTLLELSGLRVPDAVQGKSLLGLFRGDPATPAPAFSGHEGRIAAVQLGRFKYLVYKGGQERVFDLDADPREEHDLSMKQPHVRRALRALVSEWLATEHRQKKRDAIVGQLQ